MEPWSRAVHGGCDSQGKKGTACVLNALSNTPWIETDKLARVSLQATINPGLGGNLAYESIAHLSNLLHKLLQNNNHPSTEEISTLYQTLYEKHSPRAKTVVDLSGRITRYEAQDSWLLKFAARHVVPYFSDKLKADAYSNFSRGAPHLDFLPLPDQALAALAQQESAKKATKYQEYLTPSVYAGLATAAAGATAYYWLGQRNK